MLLTIVTTASHTAHLDTARGTGLLVMADMKKDIFLESSSLLESDFNAMMRELDDLGYSIAPDENGDDWHVSGTLDDGRDVLTLVHRDSVTMEPDLEDIARSFSALRRGVGLEV